MNAFQSLGTFALVLLFPPFPSLPLGPSVLTLQLHK